MEEKRTCEDLAAEELENRKYENIIAKYDYRQLVLEQAIVDTEESILYNKKKALKEEFKRRLKEV